MGDSKHGDGLNTAVLKPKAFPYIGDAGLACVSMREGVQDASPPASLPGQGSLGFLEPQVTAGQPRVSHRSALHPDACWVAWDHAMTGHNPEYRAGSIPESLQGTGLYQMAPDPDLLALT